MKGQAYINDQDIYTTWGASLYAGAYEALLTPPPMKDYISNSSRTEHGIRVVHNSTNAMTDSREVSIPFFIEGTDQEDYLTKYEAFLDEVSSGVIELQVPTLKKTYKLVYMSCSKYGDYGVKRAKLTLKFTEPNVKERTSL